MHRRVRVRVGGAQHARAVHLGEQVLLHRHDHVAGRQVLLYRQQVLMVHKEMTEPQVHKELRDLKVLKVRQAMQEHKEI